MNMSIVSTSRVMITSFFFKEMGIRNLHKIYKDFSRYCNYIRFILENRITILEFFFFK